VCSSDLVVGRGLCSGGRGRDRAQERDRHAAPRSCRVNGFAVVAIVAVFVIVVVRSSVVGRVVA